MAEKVAKGLQWERPPTYTKEISKALETPWTPETWGAHMRALKSDYSAVFKAFADAKLRLIIPAGSPAWMKTVALQEGILCREEKPAAAAPPPPQRRPWRRK